MVRAQLQHVWGLGDYYKALAPIDAWTRVKDREINLGLIWKEKIRMLGLKVSRMDITF
jgi:hypothetical protein